MLSRVQRRSDRERQNETGTARKSKATLSPLLSLHTRPWSSHFVTDRSLLALQPNTHTQAEAAVGSVLECWTPENQFHKGRSPAESLTPSRCCQLHDAECCVEPAAISHFLGLNVSPDPPLNLNSSPCCSSSSSSSFDVSTIRRSSIQDTCSSDMQIYGLLVLASPPGAGAVPLTTAWELGSFSWLQRGTVQDMMGFMARVSPSPPLRKGGV